MECAGCPLCAKEEEKERSVSGEERYGLIGFGECVTAHSQSLHQKEPIRQTSCIATASSVDERNVRPP